MQAFHLTILLLSNTEVDLLLHLLFSQIIFICMRLIIEHLIELMVVLVVLAIRSVVILFEFRRLHGTRLVFIVLFVDTWRAKLHIVLVSIQFMV